MCASSNHTIFLIKHHPSLNVFMKMHTQHYHTNPELLVILYYGHPEKSIRVGETARKSIFRFAISGRKNQFVGADSMPPTN